MTKASEHVDSEAKPRWVTLGEASKLLGVDDSTVRRWADAGRIRVFRTPGGHRRFLFASLEEMLTADGRHRRSDEVERLAVARIRRQINRAREHGDDWYASLPPESKAPLGELGRRLVEMVGEYLDKRHRRSGLLAEAFVIGGRYGHILVAAGLPLSRAVEAYIGFRHTIEETTREAALRDSLPAGEALTTYGQVHALGEQVLLGLAAAYQADLTLEHSGGAW